MCKTALSQTTRTCQSQTRCLHRASQRGSNAFGHHTAPARRAISWQEERHQQSHRIQTQGIFEAKSVRKPQKMVPRESRQIKSSRGKIKRAEALQLERWVVPTEHRNSATYGKPNMVGLSQSERRKMHGVWLAGAVRVSPHSSSCCVGGRPRDHKPRGGQRMFAPLGFEKRDDGLRSLPL